VVARLYETLLKIDDVWGRIIKQKHKTNAGRAMLEKIRILGKSRHGHSKAVEDAASHSNTNTR
jgi:hypothetical protein